MVDYHFKDWLTIEEAAAWLTDHARKPYSAAALERAIAKRWLQAYYRPDDTSATLGLYVNMAEPPTHDQRAGLLITHCAEQGAFLDSDQAYPYAMFDGPVPFYDYQLFNDCASKQVNELIGITTVDAAGTVIGGVYLMGPKDNPRSLASIQSRVLITATDLQAFAAALPTPPAIRHREVEFATVLDLRIASCSLVRFRSAQLDYDHPPKEQSQEAKNDTPALKALAFAAHLIADLADQLDTHLYGDNQSSKRLRLKLGTGRPNARKIAEQLEKTATELKHTGHGYGKSGFQETLSKALNELGLD